MKLFFSDVDKTLVDSPKEFGIKTIQAISKCSENDITFVMCSGRPTANLIIEAKKLNDNNANLRYVCGFNGAQLYDVFEHKFIYKNDLTIEDVKIITNVLKSYDLDYLIYKENNIYGPNIENPHAKHEKEICKLKMINTKDIFSSAKVLGLIDEQRAGILLNDIREKLSNYTVSMSMPFFIEITKKNINKGFGVISTAKHLNVDLSNVFVFGDGGNDLDMFLLEKVKKYAVGNAVDAIKIHADKIIDSVYDEGVAEFINEFLEE